MKVFIGFVSVIAACVMMGCTNTSLGDDAIKGRVIDSGTGRPIDNAIVYVIWDGDVRGSLGGGSSTCFHVAVAPTDGNGTFEVPAWRRPVLTVGEKNLVKVTRIIDVFKEGYDSAAGFPARPDENGLIRIRRFAGNELEWLRWSDPKGVPFACGHFDGSKKTLSTLLVRLCAERRELLRNAGKPEEDCEKPWSNLLQRELQK